MRFIWPSMSASYHWFRAAAPPAPNAMHRMAVKPMIGWIAPGAASNPHRPVNTTSDITLYVFGGIASRGARYLRFLARRASDRKRGRDGTAYSDYHASGGFLAHHLARISMAAVYWDAQHIDEGVRFLKQHAQPHA